MTKINPYFSIITSNINSLSIPNKRHRVDGLKNKIYLSVIYWKFRSKDRNRHTMKRWEKTLRSNEMRKPAGMAGLIPE